MEDFDPMEETEIDTGFETTYFMEDDPYAGWKVGDFEEVFKTENWKSKKKDTTLNDFYKRFTNPKGKVVKTKTKKDGTVVEIREKFNENTPLSEWIDYAKNGEKKGLVVIGNISQTQLGR